MFMTPLQKSIAEIEEMRNEKIKEIAEFDGWKFKGSLAYIEDSAGNIVKGSYEWRKDYLPYLTDLNAMHRVALDVMDRLQAFNYYSDMIRNALTERPINGQYTDLVDAVYDAIVYLKNFY